MIFTRKQKFELSRQKINTLMLQLQKEKGDTG